ncbi:MAG: hypothetical protein LUQ19_03935 [Methanoregula sp.]|nr:hypothetical protein [Methanoregula sp.]
MGDTRALGPLEKMLHDKDEYVRRAAEEAIKKIRKKSGLA